MLNYIAIWPFFFLNQEKCFQYWPSEGSVTFGDYTVELTGDTQCETFTLKDMVLTYRPVRQVLFPHFKAVKQKFKHEQMFFKDEPFKKSKKRHWIYHEK